MEFKKLKIRFTLLNSCIDPWGYIFLKYDYWSMSKYLVSTNTLKITGLYLGIYREGGSTMYCTSTCNTICKIYCIKMNWYSGVHIVESLCKTIYTTNVYVWNILSGCK